MIGGGLLNRVSSLVVSFDFRNIGVGRRIDHAVGSSGEEHAFGPTAPDQAGKRSTAGINPPHELGWHSLVFALVQPAQQCRSAEGASTDVENKLTSASN